MVISGRSLRLWSARSLVAVGISIAIALGAMEFHRLSATAQSGSDDMRLQALAERLLTNVSTSQNPDLVKLFPGALPTDVPADVVLPPNGTLIGSVERRASGSLPGGTPTPSSDPGTPTSTRVDIVIDVPSGSDSVVTFYKSALAALGWSPRAQTTAGFVATSLVPIPTTFCKSSDGPLLSVTARPSASGLLDVRLHYDSTSPTQCQTATVANPGMLPSPRGSILPSLESPPGVTVYGAGGSGNSARYGVESVALTTMAVSDLHAFYANELVAAGWISSAQGDDGSLSWSTWTILNRSDLQGFFYVRDGPATGQRALHLDVASTDSNALSSGAASPNIGIVTGPVLSSPVSTTTPTATPALAAPSQTPTPTPRPSTTPTSTPALSTTTTTPTPTAKPATAVATTPNSTPTSTTGH